MSHEIENTIRRFYSDWSVVSPRKLASYFTPHAELSLPIPPFALIGAEAIAGTIEIFRARFEDADLEVIQIASAAEAVLCEHLWHFRLPSGAEFQQSGQDAFFFTDGQIRSWRRYFDPLALTQNIDLGEG